jgi:hypothetical protein
LENHLQTRKARSRQAYEARIAEYNAATKVRDSLKATGDLVGAAAVTLKNKKQIPKTRPKMPAILKPSHTPLLYTDLSIMFTNFLAVEDATTVVAYALLRCEVCVLMWELDPAPTPSAVPDLMHPALLPAHERAAHHLRRGDRCRGSPTGICKPCLNRMALGIKEDRDALRAATSSS